MILIAGGGHDHNIARIVDAVASRGFGHQLLIPDIGRPLDFTFNAVSGAAAVNGIDLAGDRHSLFIRYDVFQGGDPMGPAPADSALRGKIAANWYDAVKGWALAAGNVRLLNAGSEGSDVNKTRNLAFGKQAGFDLPRTLVTNDIAKIEAPEDWIAKPPSGGEHTRLLRDVLADDFERAARRPWIVQEKLTYPEVRVFRAGPWLFAFRIENTQLDCRVNPASMRLDHIPVPAGLEGPMHALTERLGLDYAAADFKTCPKTGALKFLEINTMPMLTGYDDACGGRLSDAMALHLHRLQR